MNDTFRHHSESLELISYFESEGVRAVGVNVIYIFTSNVVGNSS